MTYTKIIKATFKLRGTLEEINRMKARIAALSSCKEVYNMSIKEEQWQKEQWWLTETKPTDIGYLRYGGQR